ncbi:MAG: DNA translocase FtsK 4TM domain-containing protein [Acidobacteria bacterium]|nr:DNA translocase FtsK 4TM domain-containing protein [Acidobacteriota bacterium]MDA1236406.1 DNA translocase FtsK 4TM domain-containing protein [Acidobacteriota bacterium]
MSGFTLRPTSNPRLNEPAGFAVLAFAVALILSLVSYYPLDPSLNVAGSELMAHNLVGVPGALFADIALQTLGLGAFLVPIFLISLGWLWMRSSSLHWPGVRAAGAVLMLITICWALSLGGDWFVWSGVVRSGGVLGSVFADISLRYLNRAGTALLLLVMAVASVYLLTSFHLEKFSDWRNRKTASMGPSLRERFLSWRAKRRRRAPATASDELEEARTLTVKLPARRTTIDREAEAGSHVELPPIVPYSEEPLEQVELFEEEEEEQPAFEAKASTIARRADEEIANGDAPWDDGDGEDDDDEEEVAAISYRIPPTALLMPPHARTAYDAEELHEVARRIQIKLEEFKVSGSVVQINPGPVVTTFEFKPDPGIKYAKVLGLSEDLCLALECESILVERIPGKSTVGIEVPNRKREIITLREVVESREFREHESPLTVALGKDINGRINVADLCSMPHLLVAGSTGSGKSVMINAFIMSILLRATPEEVRFIMVDPKTVELGLYHEIPHLLTPVITDMKKASNALKNATTEMERRLKLLAEHSVRNIDQFNTKLDRIKAKYEIENPDLAKSLKRLPYIVIIIDELADLMILEGRHIEESITRLAQMARAVGIHLVLATQRPSVNVITGLIKANVPARMSFRLATGIDSRTILDSSGAEALLGRGDMLFLPPGTARMIRLHGPFVTEEEIEKVVKEWKIQAKPRYDVSYLAPPIDETEGAEEDAPGLDDPVYEDAVRCVLEAGKASTSTLQRRLRLGYGRAARILDAMEKDGIIGPPDGSRPRDVLKAPDWLAEVESTR